MLNTINIAKCIQEAHHIGYTKFYNVCTTGDFHSVPWGAVDWVSATLVGGFVLTMAAAVTGLLSLMAVSFYKDIRGYV